MKKIRKLSKSRYIDYETGEIKYYKQNHNRSNSISNVQRSLANLRRIINLNFVGDDSERFLTLTYSVLMTDTNKLYNDFKCFIRALRKHHQVEYIAIVEPQQSGSLHMHVLLKSSIEKHLRIRIELLSSLWRHGLFHIKKLPFADNFGAYFSIRIPSLYENNEYKNNSDIQKSVVKGERLHFYPSGFKIYRCSRGINRPTPIKMFYGEAKKLTDGMSLYYSCAKQVVSVDEYGDERTLNTVNYEQYKTNIEKRNNYETKNRNFRQKRNNKQ